MKKKASAGPLNLPNALSLLRMVLVPFFVYAVLELPPATPVGAWIPAAIFAVTSFTDFLDGQIARRFHMVTDFGKFMDPLADKFMVFSALLVLCCRYTYYGPFLIWTTVVVMFRDLGVTSLRLVAAGKSGIVIAASIFGKLKTVSHITGILVILLEPLLFPVYGAQICPIGCVMLGVMTVTSVGSGIDYLRAYLPVLGFGAAAGDASVDSAEGDGKGNPANT